MYAAMMMNRPNRHGFIFSLIENLFPRDADETSDDEWTISDRAFYALFACVLVLFALLAYIRIRFGYDFF